MGVVEELVARAAANDEAAWDLLVERFAALVWSVVRSAGLSDADAADVCQTTWMRLAEHLDDLTDPSRLASWLTATARREALRVFRLGHRDLLIDPWQWLDQPDPTVEDPEAMTVGSEWTIAVQTAVAHLPERCRRLVLALAADPPESYAQLSARLDLPVGSIGPTRSRCLEHLAQLLEDVGQLTDRTPGSHPFTIPERTFR